MLALDLLSRIVFVMVFSGSNRIFFLLAIFCRPHVLEASISRGASPVRMSAVLNNKTLAFLAFDGVVRAELDVGWLENLELKHSRLFSSAGTEPPR
jgi:hypothetical protein